MDPVQILVQIYTFLRSHANEEREPAEKQLIELKTNHANEFIQTNCLILQNADKLPPEILISSLLYTRQSFKKATQVIKSGDKTESYLIIQPELANALIPILFSFFSNEHLASWASQLLGQIAVYILSSEPENQIFSAICQQISNPSTSLCCCQSIIYILQETNIPTPLQGFLFSTIIPLLANAATPNPIKSQIVLIIDSMVATLQDLIANPGELTKFVTSMLSLTAVPELKSSSYEFWENVASNIPDIISSVPDIFQLSFTDIQQLKQSTDENEMNLLMTIIRFLSHLLKPEFDETDPLLPILIQAVPSFIPVLLEISQNAYNPAALDENEDNYPHIEARNCLNAISMSLPQQSIPILISFAQQLTEQMNKGDPIQNEVLLFVFSIIIDGFNPESPPLDLESYNKMCLQCVQCVQQCCENAATTHPRVLKASLHLLLCLIDNTPELIDFSPYCTFMVAILSNSHTNQPFCDDAKDILVHIIQLPTLSLDPALIFDQLLSFDNVYSLESALEIFKAKYDNDQDQSCKGFALHFLPKLIALTEIYLTNQQDPEQSDSTVCIQLLPYVLNIIVNLIDMLKMDSVPYLGKLSPMMNFALENFDHPEALKAVCSIAFITKQNVTYAATQVLTRLKNNSGTGIEDESVDSAMRFAAISSITLYLSKCHDIAPIFHELLHTLFELLKDHQTGFRNADLEVATIEAINSLHSYSSELIKPFIPQLVQNVYICINLLTTIEDDEYTGDVRLSMIAVIMEEIRLLIAHGALEICGTELLEQSLQIIQFAITSSEMNLKCMEELIFLLIEMFKVVPDQTKQYYNSNEKLQELIHDANENLDEVKPLMSNLEQYLK